MDKRKTFVFFSERLLQEIKESNRDILTPSCHKTIAEVSARIESAKAIKRKAEVEMEVAKAKKRAEEEAIRAVKEVETGAMDMSRAARQSSGAFTRADTVLLRIQAQMPPPKQYGEMPSPGSRAAVARSIPKKPPMKSPVNLLAVAPRPKSKAPPTK